MLIPWPRAVATAAVPLLLAVTGCSVDLDRGGKEAQAQDTSTLVVDEAGIAFSLPSDWDEFDRDKMEDALADMSGQSGMDELTDRLGLTPEQFQQLMKNNIVLYAVAPHARGGFLDNLNVLVIDGELPSSGAIELEYRSLGATGTDSEDISTDVGDGYRTTYSLTIKESEVHGEVIAVDVDGRAVVITISTVDEDDSAALATTVRDSLHDAS